MHRTNAVKEGDIVFVFVKVAACFHQLIALRFCRVFFWVEIPASFCEITWESPMIPRVMQIYPFICPSNGCLNPPQNMYTYIYIHTVTASYICMYIYICTYSNGIPYVSVCGWFVTTSPKKTTKTQATGHFCPEGHRVGAPRVIHRENLEIHHEKWMVYPLVNIQTTMENHHF